VAIEAGDERGGANGAQGGQVEGAADARAATGEKAVTGEQAAVAVEGSEERIWAVKLRRSRARLRCSMALVSWVRRATS